ncbi:hypothetical protein BHE74_00036818 [Ensete ventricosum]|nr:hypothetical protein BHE74_00036818 [Ensete ventricosum]RZR92320.1 hypothetical protein BHM03_00020597 [Ensete ventricosum]
MRSSRLRRRQLEGSDQREEIVAVIRKEATLIAVADQGAVLVQCGGQKKGAALVQPTEEEDDNGGQRQGGQRWCGRRRRKWPCFSHYKEGRLLPCFCCCAAEDKAAWLLRSLGEDAGGGATKG